MIGVAQTRATETRPHEVKTLRHHVTEALLHAVLVGALVSIVLILTDQETSIAEFGIHLGCATIVAVVVYLASIRERKRSRKGTTLAPSLIRGGLGGIIGGALAGALVGVVYKLELKRLAEAKYGIERMRYLVWLKIITFGFVAKVFIYASIAGAIIGLAMHAGMIVAQRLGAAPDSAAEHSGAVGGGALGGIVAGSIAGVIFGAMPIEQIDSWLLYAACVVGELAIAMATILYEYDGRIRLGRTMLALTLFTTLIGAVVAAGVIGFGRPLYQYVSQSLLTWNPWTDHAKGGAIVGFLSGGIGGLQVGLTLYAVRRLRMTVDDAPAEALQP
jgi:hypothetical protein